MDIFEQVLVIPDVHGRTFWKDFIKGHEHEQIVFLGDYVDPYSREHITDTQALENFKEILEFKKSHPDNVILLIGNHDCSYLYTKRICNCRYSYKHNLELQALFRSNKELFSMAYECIVGDKHVVFSHAGISRQWIDRVSEISAESKQSTETDVEYVNRLYTDHSDILIEFLSDVSYVRGGLQQYGSCVWADATEWFKSTNPLTSDQYQIFGHTQLAKEPFIKNNIACVDCRAGFICNTNSFNA